MNEIKANEQDALEYQKGDANALSRIWKRNQGFLYRVCYQFYDRNKGQCCACGVGPEDLMQESFFALLEAVRAFDLERGYKFLTWVSYPLKNRFNRLLGRRGVPDPLNSCESLDEPRTDDETNTRGAMIPDQAASDAFKSVEAQIYNSELHAALDEALSVLPVQHRELLKCRYYEEKTFRECAALFHLGSPSYARSVAKKALQRMRRGQAFRILKHFLVDTSAAYTATGFSAWKYGGSVEERMIERAERNLTA